MFQYEAEVFQAIQPHVASRQRIAVVGLGYVGLPLALAFSRANNVVAFDIDRRRVEALLGGFDQTGEVERATLDATPMMVTHDSSDMAGCKVFIVTVPTPVDSSRQPDFTLLRGACRMIAPHLRWGSIVIFESTVYPGATEEICGPELARHSGLTCGTDFKLAYSPERINPGDAARPLQQIVKIVSGEDAETLNFVADLYTGIIHAGVHRASSIKVAEAAKVLENTQRDVNIALMNEMSKICDRLGISTRDVLDAAGTKWNFLAFTPGLVGGHCIGVDPYYLSAKAEQLGYHPDVIMACRRINDSMAGYIANRLVKLLAAAGRPVRAARIGILGMTFKENVPDIRNSKVVDVVNELQRFGMDALVHDPVASPEDALREHGIRLCGLDQIDNLDALILAVNHREFSKLMADQLSARLVDNGVVIDIKSDLNRAALRPDLHYWSL